MTLTDHESQSSMPATSADTASNATKSPKQARRGPALRFGLRTLFVFGIAISLVFGWFGKRCYNLRQDEAAIEALQRCGPGIVLGSEPLQWETETPLVAFDDSGAMWERVRVVLGLAGRPRLRTAYLHSHDPNDERLRPALEALKRFPELEQVGFVGRAFDGAAIEAAAELPRLKELWLNETSVTGADLAPLAKSESLLAFRDRREYSSPKLALGVARIRSLRIVHLSGDTEIDREVFEALASLSKLEELSLSQVSASGEPDLLLPLERAISLKSLQIDNVRSDGYLGTPPRLPNLEHLYLFGVVDETLTEWPVTLSLESAVFRSPAAGEAVAAFSAAHPECEVIYFAGNGPRVDYRAGELAK